MHCLLSVLMVRHLAIFGFSALYCAAHQLEQHSHDAPPQSAGQTPHMQMYQTGPVPQNCSHSLDAPMIIQRSM